MEYLFEIFFVVFLVFTALLVAFVVVALGYLDKTMRSIASSMYLEMMHEYDLINTKLTNGRKRDGVMAGLVREVLTEVKKGNKDQQEIKTRLTNLRQNVDKVKKATKRA